MKVFILLVIFSSFASAKNPSALIETNMGVIEVELYEDKAPVTVKNFKEYISKKHYDGTLFHRVINNFMIQGGGFDEKFIQKKTLKSIRNEATNGLKNTTGTLAMARTGDPHSATSQFFINVANNNFLDHQNTTDSGYGYAVFGKVTGGDHVVDRIKAVKTGKLNGHSDVPMDPVVIKKIRVK